MSIIKKSSVLLSIAAIILGGCFEKEAKYENVDRDASLEQVSAFDTSKVYLYVPSTGEAPRYAQSQNPFFTGEEKLVKFRFVEKGLLVEQIDADSRLDNDGNIVDGRYDSENLKDKLKPVMLIPGDYFDYQCYEDKFGECTNTEEIKPDSEYNDPANAWKEKKSFSPRYEDIISYEVNSASIYFQSFGLATLNTAINEDFNSTGYEVADGVLNFSLKKTFKIPDADSIIDAYYQDQLTELSFTTEFFYSFVDVKQLQSKNYTPIHYGSPEHNRFGFFKNELKYKNITGENGRDEQYAYLLNRFNPEKAQVDYHLSGNFFRPENKIFLDATYDAIAAINDLVTQVGVPRINLVNGTGKHPGDIRYNFIKLIDEPLNNGLLGFGPVVSHPMTGEVLKGQVNQYSGVARTASRRVWDDMVRLYNRGEIGKDIEPKKVGFELAYGEIVGDTPDSQTEAGIGQPLAQARYDTFKDIGSFVTGTAAALSGLDQYVSTLPSFEEAVAAERNQQMVWAKNNALSTNSVWVSATSKDFIKGLNPEKYKNSKSKLIAWADLSKKQQQEVSDAIAAQMYKSTLVHELGHNLGLRHNFMGSVDSNNFYTSNDIDKMNEMAGIRQAGIKFPPAYSSVMDYGRNIFDELPIYGKYDLAALKFAYARELEVDIDNGSKRTDISLKPFDKIYADGTNADNPIFVPQGFDNGILKFLENSKEYRERLAQAQSEVTRRLNEIAGFEAAKKLASGSDKTRIEGLINQTEAQLKQAESLVEIWTDRLNDLTDLSAETLATIQSGDFARYFFCTDENSGTSLLCNAFDEGTNIKEIIQFRIQEYKDSFEQFNFRRDRRRFNTINQFNYIVFRLNQFGRIRDVIEDYESLAGFIGQDIPALERYAQICGGSATTDSQIEGCKAFREYSDAAHIAAEFFIDLIKEPDHYCYLNVINTAEEGTQIGGVTLPAESETFVTRRLRDIYLSGISRGALRPDMDAPKSCFDPEVAFYAENIGLPTGQLQIDTPMIVKAETGRYLNSFNNEDPEFNYSSDLQAIGTWPDKLLAMQYLARRTSLNSTSYETQGALIDLQAIKKLDANRQEVGDIWSGVGNQMQSMFRQWVLFSPVENGAPWTDQSGKSVAGVPPYRFSENDQIESIGSYGIRSFFGLNETGRTEVVKSLLLQFPLHGATQDPSYQYLSDQWINSVSVYEGSDYALSGFDVASMDYYETRDAADGGEEVIGEISRYHAKENNLLAREIIDIANGIFIYEKPALEKVFERRVNTIIEGIERDGLTEVESNLTAFLNDLDVMDSVLNRKCDRETKAFNSNTHDLEFFKAKVDAEDLISDADGSFAAIFSGDVRVKGNTTIKGLCTDEQTIRQHAEALEDASANWDSIYQVAKRRADVGKAITKLMFRARAMVAMETRNAEFFQVGDVVKFDESDNGGQDLFFETIRNFVDSNGEIYRPLEVGESVSSGWTKINLAGSDVEVRDDFLELFVAHNLARFYDLPNRAGLAKELQAASDAECYYNNGIENVSCWDVALTQWEKNLNPSYVNPDVRSQLLVTDDAGAYVVDEEGNIETRPNPNTVPSTSEVEISLYGKNLAWLSQLADPTLREELKSRARQLTVLPVTVD
ncbi:zinc-dependent metalloprotease [Pelagibaculum spongiae]|uniref:EcxA zinc-binding domain-containing protein n=1 Tax=Pelagibaculum spongiae TaxID=2080658 RepID=A0A2V1GRV0_9GAMM|nr:zinc-dependent metalloprotease [Pelagibaculum spongiae]PVZ65491.1 hypothetical protein DC094_18610 [Pelagibaculum spongiae]